MGQLAPQPDLTRQCAFDLRSRLEILSTRPDGAGRVLNVRTSAGFRAAGPAPARTLGVPLRNRVTPFGDVVAVPERGLVYGNRGCLHNAAGRSCAVRRRGAGSPAGSSSAAGTAARAAPGQVHRALLPRRRDRVRRGPSAVRAVPPRRLQPRLELLERPGADAWTSARRGAHRHRVRASKSQRCRTARS